jgi:hypothetical protein
LDLRRFGEETPALSERLLKIRPVAIIPRNGPNFCPQHIFDDRVKTIPPL